MMKKPIIEYLKALAVKTYESISMMIVGLIIGMVVLIGKFTHELKRNTGQTVFYILNAIITVIAVSWLYRWITSL